jgi:GGDEF domain-containing protein/thioredoxin-like negative regulator of GroEL
MADLSKFYDKADKALQKGKPEQALDAYLDALDQDPHDSRSRESAADLYMTLGQPSKAFEYLNSLLQDHLSANDSARATPAYKKVMRVGHPKAETSIQYAALLEKLNKKEAIEAYETAIKAFQGEHRYADALRASERIVALDPRAETYKRYAELAELAGEKKLAANGYVQLAFTQEKAGFDSFEAYEKSYACDPTNMAATLGHGRALVTKGKATEALTLLEPLANYPSAPMEAREPYALALIAAGRILDAQPFIWELFEKDPQTHGKTVGDLIASLLQSGKGERAVTVARKLDDFQRKLGKRREFVQQMKDLSTEHMRNNEFLEYMAELYNANNREQDFCEVLGELFKLYYAAGNYIKATDCLERAVDVDAYEPGHKENLELLRGKVEANKLNAIGSRLGVAEMNDKPAAAAAPVVNEEPTVLEDLVLQAEIFLQYGMRIKATEKVQRIFKLFPGEEEANERVKNLYANAGFFPDYPGSSRPAPVVVASAAAPQGSTPAPAPAGTSTMSFKADDLARAAEINRNIARQSSPKGVLFAAVNDVGRGWNTSRCLSGLATPGKPPSAALEYCAPGIKQSDVGALVKLFMGVQSVCLARNGPFSAPDARNAPELAALTDVLAQLNIDALLAIPMIDADQQVGVLLLQQCGSRREWRGGEIAVFQTIADQIVMAVNNARLRSLVKTLAVTDEKSGLLKRSSYLDVVLSEVQASVQQQTPLTVALLSFGRPSALVKEFGEAPIELMMQQIGQTVCSHIRQNDVAVRYDLTEIALLLADTTDKNAALAVEKLRRASAAVYLPGREQPPVLHVGLAEAIKLKDYDPVDIVTEVINRADAALTLSKMEAQSSVRTIPSELAAV